MIRAQRDEALAACRRFVSMVELDACTMVD